MTTLAIGGFPLSASLAQAGASPEARNVQRLTMTALMRLKEQAEQAISFLELASLERELEDEDSPLLNTAPFELAERFLLALPMSIPVPELSVDPDGEISFEWSGREGRNFSVSLSNAGRLSYAGILRPGKTSYGTDQFNEVVPREIIEAVRILTGE